ncbi:MAG: SLC13 family permease [Candidatus Aminicenantales bacterium]
MEIRKKTGFFIGPIFFLGTYFAPILRENPQAHSLLAVFLLVVSWWVTECIPIPATALLIPVLMTLLGICPVKEAFAPFANPIIMLFLGSFVLARAMSLHGLDRKLAFSVLSLKSMAGKKRRILFAFGLITIFLSLWISNTATTAMMYPIALGVLSSLTVGEGRKNTSSFSYILLLTVAYSASIGGIGTPIGSPPNLIAIGMLEKLVNYRLTFFQWMVMGFIILIPMFLFLYLFMKFSQGEKERGEGEIKHRFRPEEKMEKGLSKAQKNVLIAFSITVTLWVTPGLVSLLWGKNALLALWFEDHIPEPAAAVIGALLLFLLPVDFKRGQFTISLKEALRIDWGTLLLFGGGLSLGFQMFNTGLAEIMGRAIITPGSSVNLTLLTLICVSLSVLLTEVTSNTASANMLIPIIIAISRAASINPLPPVLASAFGCSFAFMLPVATPPNAIVYGSRMVPLTKMIKFGFWLEIVGIIIIWLCIRFVAIHVI